MLYNMLCCVMFMLCYICYITRNVMLRYITYYVSFLLRYITCYVTLYNMLSFVTSNVILCCYVCYITRYVYVTLDNMLCYVIIMLRYKRR